MEQPSEPDAKDLPVLAGLLAGRLAGDPLFRNASWDAPLRFPLLWAEQTVRLCLAWCRGRAVAVGRDAVATWSVRAGTPTQRDTTRLTARHGHAHPEGLEDDLRPPRHDDAVGIAPTAPPSTAGAALTAALRAPWAGLLSLLAGLFVLGALAAPYYVLKGALTDVGLPVNGAEAAGFAAAAVNLAVLILPYVTALLRRRKDPDGDEAVRPGRSVPPGTSGAVVWLGVAASRRSGSASKMTQWILQRTPNATEIRSHVANPDNADKARVRGDRAVPVRPTAGARRRWQVIQNVPAATPPGTRAGTATPAAPPPAGPP